MTQQCFIEPLHTGGGCLMNGTIAEEQESELYYRLKKKARHILF